jgi:hypothetical protein
VKPSSKPTGADLGAAYELLVAADLIRKGFDVFRNMSPNGPVDLVVYKNRRCCRVQVKNIGCGPEDHYHNEVTALYNHGDIRYHFHDADFKSLFEAAPDEYSHQRYQRALAKARRWEQKNPTADLERILLPEEVADRLKVSLSWVRVEASASMNPLPAFRLGPEMLRFNWRSVRGWLEQQAATTPEPTKRGRRGILGRPTPSVISQPETHADKVTF